MKQTRKSPQPATLLKMRLCRRCIPVNFAKFLKNTFSNRTPPVASSERWEIVKPIKTTTCSKIPTISAVQVFSTELHPWFNFLGFFLNTRSTWECLLFLFFDWNVSCKNLFSLFLEKIRRLVLFSCKLITFNSNWSIN